MPDPQTTLHERLIERQPPEEVTRKRAKAIRRGFWTQEDIDHIHHGTLSVEVRELAEFFND